MEDEVPRASVCRYTLSVSHTVHTDTDTHHEMEGDGSGLRCNWQGTLAIEWIDEELTRMGLRER